MSSHNDLVSVTYDIRAIQRWALIDLPETVQRRGADHAQYRRGRAGRYGTVAPILQVPLGRPGYGRLAVHAGNRTVYIPTGPFIAPQLLLVDQILREAVRAFFNQFVSAGFGGLAYG